MPGKKGKRRGILFTIGSAVLFGITPSFSRQAILAGNSSEMVALYSNALAFLMLLGWAKAKKMPFVITKRQIFYLLWIGGIGQAGTSLFLYQAYAYMPAGMATLIHFFYPLLVYGTLILFFKEKPDPVKLAGLGVAAAGLAVFLEKGSVSGRGIACAALSAAAFSAYLVGIDKAGLKEVPDMVVTFYAALFSSLFLFAYNLAGHKLAGGISVVGIGYAALCALFGNVIGKLFLQRGIILVGAGLAAVFSLFEPIISLLIGVLIYQDGWSLRKTIGCVLILGAVLVISMEKQTSGQYEHTSV